jgi:hypothetical protein
MEYLPYQLHVSASTLAIIRLAFNLSKLIIQPTPQTTRTTQESLPTTHTPLSMQLNTVET